MFGSYKYKIKFIKLFILMMIRWNWHTRTGSTSQLKGSTRPPILDSTGKKEGGDPIIITALEWVVLKWK